MQPRTPRRAPIVEPRAARTRGRRRTAAERWTRRRRCRISSCCPRTGTRGLAIAAHPDDFEYGMASAVAKWTAQGKQITVRPASRGAKPASTSHPTTRDRCARTRNAEVRLWSVSTTSPFLDYRDGVVEYGLPLRRDIARAVRRVRPDVVLTLNHRDSWGGPSFNMADHRNVGLAVLDGVRDAANPWIFPELMDEGADPWSAVTMVCIVRLAAGDPRNRRHRVPRQGHRVAGRACPLPRRMSAPRPIPSCGAWPRRPAPVSAPSTPRRSR